MGIGTKLHYDQFITIGQNLQLPASRNRYARPSLNDKPKLRELVAIKSTDGLTSINVIEEVARSCRRLFYMLELSENSVKNIWHSGERTDQCEKTIEKWLEGQGSTPITWQTLIAALEQVQMTELMH